MQAVIIFESLTGKTEQAARLIADAFYRHDVATKLYRVEHVDAEAIAEADLVVVGTWTDGLILVGQRPAKAKNLKALPSLAGKKSVVYCTYAVDKGRTLDKLQTIVEELGAEVLGGMAIRRDHLADGADEFVERIMGVLAT